MNTPSSTTRSGRIRWVTAASVGAVGFAAALAIAANVGILDASGDNGVGQLSATGDVTTIAAPTTAAAPTASVLVGAPSATPGSQQFTVDAAGTVTIAPLGTGIRLEEVRATDGWTWTLAQPADNQLTVTFTDGARTLDFVAIGRVDGTVDASVSEPIVTAAPAPAANGGGEHEGEEHEGGEDDD